MSNGRETKMSVNSNFLKNIVEKQFKIVLKKEKLKIVKAFATKLELADFENKRLRSRFQSLEEKVLKMIKESKAHHIRKPSKDVCVQVDFGEESANIQSKSSQTEEAVIFVQSEREYNTTEASVKDLVVGGCGFQKNNFTQNEQSMSEFTSLVLKGAPIKREPFADTKSSRGSVFLSPEEATDTTQAHIPHHVPDYNAAYKSMLLTPDISPKLNTRHFKFPAQKLLDLGEENLDKQNILKYATTTSSISVSENLLKSSISPRRVSPVLLRKISANNGKIAIIWDVCKEIDIVSDFQDISGYEVYQASPVKMWQLVETLPTMKLPIVVVMSPAKQQVRYQFRLKILFKDGSFVFSNILSFVT